MDGTIYGKKIEDQKESEAMENNGKNEKKDNKEGSLTDKLTSIFKKSGYKKYLWITLAVVVVALLIGIGSVFLFPTTNEEDIDFEIAQEEIDEEVQDIDKSIEEIERQIQELESQN